MRLFSNDRKNNSTKSMEEQMTRAAAINKEQKQRKLWSKVGTVASTEVPKQSVSSEHLLRKVAARSRQKKSCRLRNCVHTKKFFNCPGRSSGCNEDTTFSRPRGNDGSDKKFFRSRKLRKKLCSNSDRLRKLHLVKCSNGKSRQGWQNAASVERIQWWIKTLCLLAAVSSSSATPSQLNVSRESGVAGESAKLPCVATQHRPGTVPVLVLWYKNGARRPFYTLDLRGSGGSEPEEFVGSAVEGRIGSPSSGAWLQLMSLAPSDAGLYRCRVDFENSPTLSALVNLTVYEVPSQLVIQDNDRKPVTGTVLGPLMEGDKLTVYCVSAGGRPPPRVSWWSGSTLLSDRSFVLGLDGTILSSQEIGLSGRNTISLGFETSKKVPGLGFREGNGPPYVVTELTMPALTKDHAGINLTCRASNNNLTAPIVKSVSLNVYLHPTSVEVSSLTHEAFEEDNEARLECETEGSIPAANISWTKTVAGVTENLPASVQQLGGKSVSRLRISPKYTDHGAKIVCRAHNPYLSGPGMTSTVSLNVKFAPRVSLHLGTSLAGRPINEAEDVYFECEVQCNPSPRSIMWRRDDELVSQNLKAGILVSGKNLVLQRVHRTSAGNYTCTVTNEMGTTTSSPVELSVRFLPVCADDPVIVAVGEGEKVSLKCRVEAHPIDQLRFTWYFNNTLDTKEVNDDRITVEGDHSVVNHIPTSPRDYGTLSCWATNQVGTQAEPCTFTIVEAGPPESVRDCMLVNHTLGALEVRCSPGGDGGSPQRFVAKVFASPTHTQLATLEASLPKFHVTGLIPGQDYLVTITAVNDKGASEPEQIDAIRLKVAEKRMGEVSAPAMSPLVGVFLGLVGGFFVLLLVAFLLTRRARSNGNDSCSCIHSSEGSIDLTMPSKEDPHQFSLRDSHATNECAQQTRPSKNVNTQPQVQRNKSDSITSLQQHFRGHHVQDDDEEEEEGPDLVKTSNETSQLLGFGKCPEIVLAKRPPSYIDSTKGMITPTQVLSQASSPGLSHDSYLESPSPHRLPHDESFV